MLIPFRPKYVPGLHSLMTNDPFRMGSSSRLMLPRKIRIGIPALPVSHGPNSDKGVMQKISTIVGYWALCV